MEEPIQQQEPTGEQKKERKGFPLRYGVYGFILLIVILGGIIAYLDYTKGKGDLQAIQAAMVKHIEILNTQDSEGYWDILTTLSKSKTDKTYIEQFMSRQRDQAVSYELIQLDSSGIAIDTNKNEASVRGRIKVTNNGIMLLDLARVLTLSVTNLSIENTNEGLLITQDISSDKGSRGQFMVLFAPSEETSVLAGRLQGIDVRSVKVVIKNFQNGLLITYELPEETVLTVFTPPATLGDPSFYMYAETPTGRETIIPKTAKCKTLHVRILEFYELWRKEDGVWKYVEKAAELPTIPQTPPPPFC